MSQRRYRRWGPPAQAARRQGKGRLRALALAVAAAALVATVVVAGVAVGWRLWFAPPGEAAPIEACADPRCQVRVAVAVDGVPLAEPLSFVLRADTPTEIDFVFRGLPVAPQELRLVTPPDQRWLVAEGTLSHPQAWLDAGEGGTRWVAGWDRASNGAGPLRRWWRLDPAASWVYVLETPPAVRPPSGGYAAGSDALVTVDKDTPAGNYVLTIEAVGSAEGRPVTAQARLVVGVLARSSAAVSTEPLPPSGRRLYSSQCAGCHGNTPNETLRAVLAEGDVSLPVDRAHRSALLLEPEQRSRLVGYLLASGPLPQGQAPLVPHKPQDAPCLDCHGTGSMSPAPEGHATGAGRCTDCHQPGPPEMYGPPVPHPRDLGSPCLDCHTPGGRLPLSDTHLRRDEGTCALCHDFERDTAPEISHQPLTEWSCLTCHDRDGLVPMPPEHRHTANWACLVCHRPASGVP